MSCPEESSLDPSDIVVGFSAVGILGVVPSNAEVVGVFPSLSATVIPHAQEIKFRRGDSFDIDVQVQNDADPPSRIDIARSILRFGVKQGFGQNYSGSTIGNEGAQLIKRSSNPAEIELINELNGQARIKIKKADTINHPLGLLNWDLELTAPVEHLADQPGTLIVVAGQGVIQGVGTDFITAGIAMGDIVHVQGRYVMITEVYTATSMMVDFTDWTTEQNLEYNLYRGHSKTIASGHWNCVGDVII